MKPCPCCLKESNRTVVEPYFILSSAFTSKTKSIKKFSHHPVFCEYCGHIFNSTQPSSQELSEYYIDQISHIAEDYDIDKRLSLIKQFSNQQDRRRLIDYGGNSEMSFHADLRNDGWDVQVVDIKKTTIEGQFDFITSYFMLEHVVNPDEIFEVFRSISKENTRLLIEVPDTEIYSTDYSGLLFEHQQHFQISSLQALAFRFGYKLLHYSREECSRSFGFVAVFEFSDGAKLETPTPNTDVIEYYKKARNNQIAEDNYPKWFYDNFDLKSYKALVFWGINANLEKICNKTDLSGTKNFALDMNLQKADYLDSQLFTYYVPDDFISRYADFLGKWGLNNNEVCFICTATAHSATIEQTVKQIDGNFIVYDPQTLND